MPHEVVMWTRPGCHLCEDLAPALEQVCAEEGARLELRDVDADPDARRRYGEMIPVVLVDGVQHGMLRVSAERVRLALRGLA